MASFRKLKSGKWNVQVRVTGHKPCSATFNTKNEAKAWAKQTVISLKDDRAEFDLLELGEKYCAIGLKGKPSQFETHKQLGRICGVLQKLSLPLNLGDMKPEHINAYRIHRLQTVATATCRKEIMLISRICRWAKREYLFDLGDPVEGVALPSPSKPCNRVVEPHEVKMLLGAMSPIMAAIVEVAYETAMRRGEIVKLTPRDLNLEERFLTVVDGKTGDRVVPLTRRAVELLSEASEKCGSPTQRLYPIEPHGVSAAFRKARKRVGLEDDVRLHQLRHTRITMVARKGFNQAQIMMVSGHRDVRSVQRYTHLSVSDVIGLLD